MNFDDPLDYFRQSHNPRDKLFVAAIEKIRSEVIAELEELRRDMKAMGMNEKDIDEAFTDGNVLS